MNTPRVLVGTVGYYHFLRSYPLGPELMERLRQRHWADHVSFMEMNWGPIAIAQDLEARESVYDRVVLIAAVERGDPAGTVTARRWIGGALDAQDVQQRVFEGVTGIISLDNLLVIGEHFGVWPDQVITVEAELPESLFGDLVLSERMLDRPSGELAVVGEQPLTPEREAIVNALVAATERAVTGGADALPEALTLSTDDLRDVVAWCHNRVVEGVGTA